MKIDKNSQENDKTVRGDTPEKKPMTEKMMKLLAAMAEGSNVHYMPYAGRFNPCAYYFSGHDMRRCTKQVDGLLERGFAEKYDQKPYSGNHKVRITDAGRAALRSWS